MKWKQTNWKEILLIQLIKQIYSIYKDTTERMEQKADWLKTIKEDRHEGQFKEECKWPVNIWKEVLPHN